VTTNSQPNGPGSGGQWAGLSLAALRRGRIPIATKLILGYLLVCLIVGVTFGVVGVRIIGGLIVSEAQEKVRTDLNAAREIYHNHLVQIGDRVRFVADRTFVRDGSVRKDRAKLVETLAAIGQREKLDMLGITDATGKVLLRATNPEVSGDDLGQNPLVREVLRRREPVTSTCVVPAEQLRNESPALAERARFEFIPTPKARPRAEREETSGLMLQAAAPIFDLQGRFAGVAYGGVLLNRNFEIVDKIKHTVFQGIKYRGEDIGTATIFQDDLRISTNVKNEDGSRAVGTRVSEDVYGQVVRQGQHWIGRAYVVNAWCITAYEPIRDLAHNIVGMLYVGVREQKYTDTQVRATIVFLAITLAGGAISMAAFYFVSRNISGSIRKLVTASRDLAHGNFDTRVQITSGDELHELADTFNFMADSLRKRDEKLKAFATRKIMESERLAVIGQLAAGVAHEMNNPLTGIVTYSHLLLEHAKAGNGSGELLRKIATQADRCRAIVRGLLDFSRQKKPEKRSCNINQLIQECISLVENQALFHNITVEKHFQPDLPPAAADPAQIQQVFMNLIINAAEAMDGNGRLAMTTRLEPDGFVEVRISDSGHGVSEADMERIFDPFFTTKEVGHGTGLGLAISFGIVKEHEGTIAVESEEGKGATFTVRLPAQKEAGV
jgi:two-component system NtrC family sensor kinase